MSGAKRIALSVPVHVEPKVYRRLAVIKLLHDNQFGEKPSTTARHQAPSLLLNSEESRTNSNQRLEMGRAISLLNHFSQTEGNAMLRPARDAS